MQRIAAIITGFVAGAAATVVTLNGFDGHSWTRALYSFTCGAEGRMNVHRAGEDISMCVDMSDAYPSEEALGRILARLAKAEGE